MDRADCPLLTSPFLLQAAFRIPCRARGGCAAVHPITSLNTHVRPLSPWRCRFSWTPVTCTAAAPALDPLAGSLFAPSGGGALPPLPAPHAGGSAVAMLRASRHFWSTKFQKASSMASLIQAGRSFAHWRQSVGGILARMPGSVWSLIRRPSNPAFLAPIIAALRMEELTDGSTVECLIAPESDDWVQRLGDVFLGPVEACVQCTPCLP